MELTEYAVNALANPYARFFAVLAASIILIKLFHYLLKTYVKQLTQKTKTDLDDVILDIVMTPFYYLTLLIGVYFALKFLPETAPHEQLINNVFFVAGVLVVALVFSRVFKVLIPRWLKVKKKFEKTPLLISKGVSVAVYLIAFLIILGYFQVEITPMIAAFGIGGLAIGLALQNTLSNFFAGIHIISDKPITVGDFIELDDGKTSGVVEDIGWRSTRIRTLPNNLVIIPNAKLAESIILNDSSPKETGFIVPCGVSYGSDLNKVEKITVDVATQIQKTVPGAVKTFKPFIRYNSFGDSNINFSVILHVETFTDKYIVTHEFIKALKTRYDKEGIEISWPVRKIYGAK